MSPRVTQVPWTHNLLNLGEYVRAMQSESSTFVKHYRTTAASTFFYGSSAKRGRWLAAPSPPPGWRPASGPQMQATDQLSIPAACAQAGILSKGMSIRRGISFGIT
jgi:hypothetical protein